MASNYDHVAALLQNKAVDIFATDIFGSTPLHCACQGGNKGIVELLIQESAKSASHKNDAHSQINPTDTLEVSIVSAIIIIIIHVEYTTWYCLYKRIYRNS